MNRKDIKKLIPHREPMLLLDELTLDEQGKAHGVYRVRGDEFFLQGHFPDNPVVPGVILCEIIGQTCSILIGDKIVGKTPYFTGIDKVKFKHPVLPGDTAEVTAFIEKSKGPFYFAYGELSVGGALCVCGHYSFALVDGKK